MAVIVFDLDGTLIHSAPDIHDAVNRMLADESLAPLSLERVTSFVGNGVPRLVERVMRDRGLDPARHAELMAVFLRYYEANPTRLTRPFPGVEAALKALAGKGHVLGVCTNKPAGVAADILEKLGLGHYFKTVFGGDSLPEKKPDPKPLLACIKAMGGGEAIYVGDSEVDAECAERAGVPFILFAGGYRKTAPEKLQHSAVFEEFGALLGLIGAGETV